VLLEKSEELHTKLDEQKEDSKNAFIQAKKDFEDKGMRALKHKVTLKCMHKTAYLTVIRDIVVFSLIVTVLQ